MVNGFATGQSTSVFDPSFFLDFDGRTAGAALRDVERGVDGGIGTAIGRDSDKRGIAGTTATSGRIGSRPGVNIIRTA